MIEGVWSQLRRSLPPCGIGGDDINSYLPDFMRKKNTTITFTQLVHFFFNTTVSSDREDEMEETGLDEIPTIFSDDEEDSEEVGDGLDDSEYEGSI
ncbi:hypothetical protein BLNAU_13920 [Blattamonas nauphoetae]|uniref:Transposase n=1 Tax=Blattamonas nauphoetae TaxID=2049346 RepID=A0ABQ9XII4_9EUKA|nr:hypothetical protein BLNAU_13920 [Blattamonas nauphoetae]